MRLIFIDLWLTCVWRLICNLRFFTIRVPYGRPISPIRPLLSCHGSFICVGCKSGIPSGRLISLTGLPSSRLRSVSREDIFGKSPPSLPFGTGVPSCPLKTTKLWGTRGRLFCSRTIWFLIRAIMTTTSFCANSSIIHFIINIFSSRRIRWSDWLFWSSLWWRRCFIWRRCNSRNWIFWNDFI